MVTLVPSYVCGFCGLHTYAPVLQQARGEAGRAADRRVMQQLVLQPSSREAKRRPNFNGKNMQRCTNCPAHCLIRKTGVWIYTMEEHYSTKHAGIDLPAHLMIRQLERASMGNIK
jgi:hypothetical protein